MSFSRKLARLFRVEKAASKLLGKMHPHDGSRVDGVDYAEGLEVERMVFICGLHRSGTTLLERMLTAQFDVSCLRANVPESEGQHMQSVFPPASNFGGPGRFAFSREMQAQIDALGDYDSHRRAILADWQRFMAGTSSILIEKSPPNLTKIAWLRKTFPQSRFIIMSRDPRAVAGATQKWSGTSIAELVMHWNAAYSRALADFQERDCVIVRYEDLVEAPTRELTRIADVLNLPERAESAQLEQRHQRLGNTNQTYFGQQDDLYFGRGVWSEFGYDF